MAIIKRRTIPTGTLKLKRLKNDLPQLSNSRHKYVVEFPDGDQTDAWFDRQTAEFQFDRIADQRTGPNGSGGFFGDGGGGVGGLFGGGGGNGGGWFG